MFPDQMQVYLSDHGVSVRPVEHARAVSALELAEALGVSGHQVAKTVLFEADGERWLAVLPASEVLDEERVRHAFGAHHLRLLDEREFEEMFPGCEVGAAPPFGRLFSVPMIVDAALARQESIVVRGGSHDVAFILKYAELDALEHPAVADIAALPRVAHPVQHEAPSRTS
jgi:Ala-tRNA(Pro) deacylase